VTANSLDLGTGGLVIDPISIVEIGLLGGSRKGAVTVDPGTTFGLGALTYASVPVVDNGAVIFGGTANTGGTLSGGVSGTGTLIVNANGEGTVKGGITGLAGIVVNDGGKLMSIDNDTSGVGAINAGVKASVTLGNVTGAGPISIGANSSFGAKSLQDDAAIAIGSGAAFNVSGTMQRSAGNGMAVSMGANSVLSLSGQDVNMPIALGTRGNVALNLNAGSNIGGAFTGFDSSDLIRSVQTFTNTLVVNQATWAPGVLTLSSGSTPVTTVALAGGFTGQTFLTNSVGIAYGDTDVVLPGAVVNGLGAGTQSLTGGAGRSFNLLTGGGTAGAMSVGGNLAMSGTYGAASLALQTTAAGTIDALGLQANSALTVAGDVGVQSNLELTDHSTMTAGGRLTIGGSKGYFGEVMLLGASRLQAASMTLLGKTDPLGGSNSNPDVAILGSSTLELGSRGGAAAGTLTIDPGAILTGAVETGKIIVATVRDDGAIVMAPSAQGLSQLQLTGDLTGAGTLTTIKNSNTYVAGSLTGLSALNLAGGGTLSVGGNLVDAVPVEVGGTLKVLGATTGLTALQLDAGAQATLQGAATALGAITLANGASLTFGAAASGAGLLSVGANATLAAGGLLTGWSSVALGVGVKLIVDGSVAPPVSLAGSDEVVVGDPASITGAISGFDLTDKIARYTQGFYLGRHSITGATWVQGANGTGTLTLSKDGAVLHTLTLAGNYTTQTFITDAVTTTLDGSATNPSEVTLANASQAGLGNIVMGGTVSLNIAAGAARNFALFNFVPGTDKISLSGYDGGTIGNAIANQVSADGQTVLTLGDQTQI